MVHVSDLPTRPRPSIVIRGGYGISYVHYTRAGSGDILAINAPNALFVSVTQPKPGSATYRTVDQGFPTGLATTFNPKTDNITYIPKNTRDSYVQDYFISVQNQLAKNSVLDVAFVGNHGVKLQGFLNANQINPAAGFTRPFTNWPSDITAAVNEFWSQYQALQVRYEQRSVYGLTLLNSFTWSHSLDNASASLEGNTPSPQDGTNIAADYSQSDYNLPVADVLSLVYDLPFGRGKQFLGQSNGVVNSIVGGWQLSGINTMQAGTPFNLTYTPNSATAVSPQIAATYRGANEYRPNRVPGAPLQERVKLSSGYIQYVNYAALSLPATRSASGSTAEPVWRSQPQSRQNTGVLHHRLCPQQELRHTARRPQGRNSAQNSTTPSTTPTCICRPAASGEPWARRQPAAAASPAPSNHASSSLV